MALWKTYKFFGFLAKKSSYWEKLIFVKGTIFRMKKWILRQICVNNGSRLTTVVLLVLFSSDSVQFAYNFLLTYIVYRTITSSAHTAASILVVDTPGFQNPATCGRYSSSHWQPFWIFLLNPYDFLLFFYSLEKLSKCNKRIIILCLPCDV